MAKHERFNFQTLGDIRQKVDMLGADIGFSEDFGPLRERVAVGKYTAPNALAILPMEGCDSNPGGSPSALVERRYLHLASGGAGLLWWEACAVLAEGRANPLQMMLTEANVGDFAALRKRRMRPPKICMGIARCIFCSLRIRDGIRGRRAKSPRH